MVNVCTVNLWPSTVCGRQTDGQSVGRTLLVSVFSPVVRIIRTVMAQNMYMHIYLFGRRRDEGLPICTALQGITKQF